MYKLFIVFFLNRTPSIYLHIKMYSEVKILHFYLPKEIDKAATSYNNCFFKECKGSRKVYKNSGSTCDKRHSFLMHHLLWRAPTHTQSEPLTEYTRNIT